MRHRMDPLQPESLPDQLFILSLPHLLGSFELCPYLKHRETPFHRLILNKIKRFLDKVHPPKQQQETKHWVLDKMQ